MLRPTRRQRRPSASPHGRLRADIWRSQAAHLSEPESALGSSPSHGSEMVAVAVAGLATRRMPIIRRTVLEPFFVHNKQLAAILGEERVALARMAVRRTPDLPANDAIALANQLGRSLADLNVQELQRCVLADNLHVGQLVGVEQVPLQAAGEDRPDSSSEGTSWLGGALSQDGLPTLNGRLFDVVAQPEKPPLRQQPMRPACRQMRSGQPGSST